MSNARTPTVAPEKGAALRAAREGAGIPRTTLAKHADIDHSHLARFESGERPISVVAYERCLTALADLLPGGGSQ